MSNPYWSQYPPGPPSWTPPSQNSELPLEYRFEQMKLLGSIDARLENVQEDVADLREDFNRHVETCNQPKRKVLSVDNLKENWTVFLLLTQVAVFFLLQMTGQADKAQQVWASSPAFRGGEKAQD